MREILHNIDKNVKRQPDFLLPHPFLVYDKPMISYIHGEILDTKDRYAIVLVNGIGYKVFSTKQTLSALEYGIKTEFHCYMAVRENALDLYGFITREELDFFELLITVSKIGPKTALGILDAASPQTIRTAIVSGDTSQLTRVSGIGKKNAEKIVLELKNKVTALASDPEFAKTTVSDNDTVDALVSLGYSQKEAMAITQDMPKDIETTEEKIKYALRTLGK